MSAVAATVGWAPRNVATIRVALVLGHRPDQKLVAALKRGDEAAFAALVDRHHRALVQVATLYVGDHSTAEEVAQETWLHVLRGLDGFQGRSSLKTWIFTILVNRAKTRGVRERRQIPAETPSEINEPSVSADRFRAAGGPGQAGSWALAPRPWPEERLMMRETIDQVRQAVQQLPQTQQVVLGLRDVEGWTAAEVCAALELTPGNERVLLHRARSRVRRQLEEYFDPT